MRITASLFTGLLALGLGSAAHAANYSVQPAASTLGFTSDFQGTAFDGQFKQWTAQISYDPAKLATSKFDVVVQLSTVSTGDKDRDGALPGSDFFDVAKTPTAHFVSTGFSQQGGQVIATGNLTLHGITKPISLNVSFKPQGSGAVLDVAGSVNRLDFNVGSGDYKDTSVIGAQVKIKAHLVLSAK